jgi:hypothetical protein
VKHSVRIVHAFPLLSRVAALDAEMHGVIVVSNINVALWFGASVPVQLIVVELFVVVSVPTLLETIAETRDAFPAEPITTVSVSGTADVFVRIISCRTTLPGISGSGDNGVESTVPVAEPMLVGATIIVVTDGPLNGLLP